MCVIVYKPRDKQIEKRDLWNMWTANPDGAGFAYLGEKDDGTAGWFFEKGFMKFKTLRKRLRLFNEYELILHFRRKTHGVVSSMMCHPFPLHSAESDIHLQTHGQSDVLFHNGIISKFGDDKVSDTFDFTTSVLVSLDNEARRKILDTLTSKFALLTGDSMYLSGYFTDFKGLKVSNTNFDYKPVKHVGFDYNDWHRRTYCPQNTSQVIQQSAITLPYSPAVTDANEAYDAMKAKEEEEWEEFIARNRYFEM